MKWLCCLGMFALIACSGPTEQAGGSTVVENGIALEVKDNGHGVQARVLVLPAQFNPLSEDSSAWLRLQTDAQGKLVLTEAQRGKAVLVQTETQGAYLASLGSDSVVQLELEPLVQVQFESLAAAELGLIGTPFVAQKTSSNAWTIQGVPPGTYSGVIIQGFSVEGQAGDSNWMGLSLQMSSLTVARDTVLPSDWIGSFRIDSLIVSSTVDASQVVSVSVDPMGRPWVSTARGDLWYQGSPVWQRMTRPTEMSLGTSLGIVRMGPEIPEMLGLTFMIHNPQGTFLFEDGEYFKLDTLLPSLKNEPWVAMDWSPRGVPALVTEQAIYWRPRGASTWQRRSVTGVRTLGLDSTWIWYGTNDGKLVQIDLLAGSARELWQGQGAIPALHVHTQGLTLADDRGLWWVERQQAGQIVSFVGQADSLRQIVQDSAGFHWAISGQSKILRFQKLDIRTLNLSEIGKIQEIDGQRTGIVLGTQTKGSYQITWGE